MPFCHHVLIPDINLASSNPDVIWISPLVLSIRIGDHDQVDLLRGSRPPLLDLRVAQLPQLVDAWCLTRSNALSQFDEVPDNRILANRILCRLGLDADQDNAWVFGTAIMLSVTKIANPSLQRGRVVLLD